MCLRHDTLESTTLLGNVKGSIRPPRIAQEGRSSPPMWFYALPEIGGQAASRELH